MTSKGNSEYMITFSWWLLLIIACISVFIKQLLEKNNIVGPSVSIKNALWILLVIGFLYDVTGISGRMIIEVYRYTDIDVYSTTSFVDIFLVVYYLVSLLLMFLWLKLEKIFKVSPYILICMYVVTAKASFAIFHGMILFIAPVLAITVLVIWIRQINKSALMRRGGDTEPAAISSSGAGPVQQPIGNKFQKDDSIRYILGGILLVGGILLIVFGIVEMNSDEQKVRNFISQVTQEDAGNRGVMYIVFGAISTIAGIVMLGIKRKPINTVPPVMHPMHLQKMTQSSQCEQAAALETQTQGYAEPRSNNGTIVQTENSYRTHKFCGDCGTKNETRNAFCTKCGERFKELEE